ncbi:Trehalase [Mycena chlorophos]|uniref:Trehalase n=1 Tax=Mycena chlorophos TaxID=658473 RepID=A0A8H6W7B1_MYCCL|nr:Trehalase [Mycena chlorophos]
MRSLSLLLLVPYVLAQSESVSRIPVTTVTATPSGSSSTPVESQDPLPPVQAWCPSEIFCAGSLLQTLNLAQVFADPKTIVDKPTSKTPGDVLADFAKLPGNTSVTEGDIVSFVDNDFGGEGQELEGVSLPQFTNTPAFLSNISDPLVQAFASQVHGFWPTLARGTNQSALCDGIKCQGSLVPLNHTFIIPGGRFREQYYWDSFFIVEGLLESGLYEVANATLQNFLDEIEKFGFIPNGGRIYYLNRSQPPLFIQMLARYVEASGDTSILDRALPLAERELEWWKTNRTISVTSPSTNKTYSLAQYNVRNTAPRPESYLDDYTTVHGVSPALNSSAQADLFAELASGAETGWDYSSRWLKDVSVGLPSLNVRGLVQVDLNSILYKNHLYLAELYNVTGSTQNATAANNHLTEASQIKAGILDLCWNATKLAFYDFNLLTNAQNTVFTAATYYPFWSGIFPDEVLSNATNAFSVFSSVNMVLNRYNGTLPVTFIVTGQQWDAPNAWPPHTYVAINALKALPANISSGALPQPAKGQNTYSLIPAGQINVAESDLPAQTITSSKNASTSGVAADLNTLNGTVTNGGNATSGEGWAATLARELANRYVSSVICSWQATGGSIQGFIPRLSDAELNITQSVSNDGNMFEKFDIRDIDSSGSGGEYTVQAGFGWTNGVLLWVSSNFGKQLVAPQCPPLLVVAGGSSGGSSKKGAAAGLMPPRMGVALAVAAVGALASSLL